MITRKRLRLRTFFLHSLAIGATISCGGWIAAADPDDAASLKHSETSPNLVPVDTKANPQRTVPSTEVESSRRRAAKRHTPLPFEPPIIIATESEPTENPVAEKTTSAWIPRGTSNSQRSSAAYRFTPWTTPEIARHAPGKSVRKPATESTAIPSQPMLDQNHAKLGDPQSDQSLQQRVPMIVNPTTDDPDPAPVPQHEAFENTSDSRTESHATTESDTSSESRVAMRDVSAKSSRTESATKSSQLIELEISRSEDAIDVEVESLSPVRSRESNEPIDDIVEPSVEESLPEETATDGDIDAESLERLRAAIRSFPTRSAIREQDSTASPSDSATETEDQVSGVPQAAARQPLVLTPEVQAMRTNIARVLVDYYRRPENVAARSPWGTFHLMLPFGADANVQSGNRLFNSIGWLCSNQPCRGQRLITTTRSGRIYVRQGPGLQGHQAQLLAMLAQVNVETTYPITDGRNRFTVEDLIRAEMADCRKGQELTFSLIGLSHYLPTDTQWRASDGSTWNFETLIAEELAQPVVGAACGGTHRLMGFSYALRQRRMEGLPIEGQWLRAEAFVNDFVDYAWSLQNRDGSFSTNWFEGPEDNRDIDRKIQTTGHILEWLIFTADQDQLQDERFVRGVKFLTSAFSRYRTRTWEPGPKGHVLRSLSLYHRRVYGDARPWAQPTKVAQPQRRSYR